MKEIAIIKWGYSVDFEAFALAIPTMDAVGDKGVFPRQHGKSSMQVQIMKIIRKSAEKYRGQSSPDSDMKNAVVGRERARVAIMLGHSLSLPTAGNGVFRGCPSADCRLRNGTAPDRPKSGGGFL